MINDSTYYHFLNLLLDGKRKECTIVITDLINENEPREKIYIELLQKSMYRVGQLWENNKISISKEHLATQIIKHILNLIQFRSNGIVQNGKKAVIACVEKEFHDIGAQMIADFLEHNGYEVFNLGANVPGNDIISTIEEFDPDLIGISSNFYINIIRLTKLVEEINYKFTNKEIIIGGQALLNYDPDVLHKFPNIHYIPDLHYLKDYLEGNFS